MTRIWQTIDVPEIGTLTRAVWLRSQILPARHGFPLHTHPWNQFVYATSGTLMVTIEQARYVITPEQAIWIPAGVLHTTTALNDVEFRNLYIDGTSNVGMPTDCIVLAVSTLLRALMLELAIIAQEPDQSGYHDHLDAVILRQISRLPRLEFSLPWPRSDHLRKICNSLHAHPDDPRAVAEWASQASVSPRTLARHFNAETGMSLRVWRHRLRVFRAIELLGANRSVTDVAMELGFSTALAFTYAFRSEMGCSPTKWLE